MKPTDTLLERMLAAARAQRRAAAPADEAAPFGLATRLASRWAAGMPEGQADLRQLWERAAGRTAAALAVAAILVTASVWHTWTPEDADQETTLETQLHEIVYPL